MTTTKTGVTTCGGGQNNGYNKGKSCSYCKGSSALPLTIVVGAERAGASAMKNKQ